VIQVQVVGARGLAKMDGLSGHSGSADPFVVLTRGEYTQQTRVQKGSLEPTWNESFTFDVTT
jgi:Ca2+-dependent lipid-binding protein